MNIEFIKDDPTGIKKGQKKTVNAMIGNRLIKNGLAKEVKPAKKKASK